MAVGRNYLLGKAPPPAVWKEVLNRRVVPALIDAAGLLEAGVEQIAVQVRARPLMGFFAAAGLGMALSTLGRPRRQG